MINRLFIDVGVGDIDIKVKEAWHREKDFTIIGLEPCTSRYNNCKDVYPGKLLNLAASDKNEEIYCWEEPDGKNGVILFKAKAHKDYNMKRIKKKAIKLDSLEWKNFDEIHIWADIEGAELLMLKGATEMLSSGKVKWINLEIRRNAPTEGWCTAKQVYEFLAKYKFKTGAKLARLSTKRHRNVIFIPKEV